MNFRRFAAALALGAGSLLCGMPVAAQDTPAEAPPPPATEPVVAPAPPPISAEARKPLAPIADMAMDAGKYTLFLSPRMIIPAKDQPAPGTRKSFAAGDVLLEAPLGWLFHGSLKAPVTVEIAGMKQSVQPGEVLRRALRFTGGDNARFDKEAPVYCQAEKYNQAQGLLSAMSLGLTDLATKVAKETALCLIDGDGDGSFDHAFLSGLKLPEDRKAVKIDPVGYTEKTALDEASWDEGDFIRVRLAPNAGLFGRSFLTEVSLGGKPVGASGYYWYIWPSFAKIYASTTTKVATKNYPATAMFTNAMIKVHGYDKAAKTVDIEYVRGFDITPLTLVFTTYY